VRFFIFFILHVVGSKCLVMVRLLSSVSDDFIVKGWDCCVECFFVCGGF